MDSSTGLLRLNSSQFNNLQSLFFHIGSTTFEFIPNAQIWPRALNTMINGTSGNAYLIVGSVSRVDIVIVCQFIERIFSHRLDEPQDRDWISSMGSLSCKWSYNIVT